MVRKLNRVLDFNIFTSVYNKRDFNENFQFLIKLNFFYFKTVNKMKVYENHNTKLLENEVFSLIFLIAGIVNI